MLISSPLTALHLSTSPFFSRFSYTVFGALYLSLISFYPLVQFAHAGIINYINFNICHCFFSLYSASIYDYFFFCLSLNMNVKAKA